MRGVAVAEEIRSERIPDAADLLQRATRMDFENYLAEDILVKVDRASMLNSLEVRAPLLDYRVIEFAFGKVPSALKATASGRKLLLKKLAATLLPPGFDARRKQGFSIPLASWLRDRSWHEFFRDVLLAPNPFFSHKLVRRVARRASRKGVPTASASSRSSCSSCGGANTASLLERAGIDCLTVAMKSFTEWRHIRFGENSQPSS